MVRRVLQPILQQLILRHRINPEQVGLAQPCRRAFLQQPSGDCTADPFLQRPCLFSVRGFASRGSAAQLLNARLLTDSFTSHYCGPLAVTSSPGKGRGLITTEPVSVGDLLLACQPLAYVPGSREEPDELPDPQGLVTQLLGLVRSPGRFTSSQRAWLQSLYRGEAAAPASSTTDTRLLNTLLHASAESGQPGPSGPSERLEEGDLEALVACNAYGDKYDDLVAAAAAATSSARRAQPSTASVPDPSRGISFAGVWPHFSLLNHSCLPTAIHYTISRTLVVRAAQDMSPGEEVSVSYLGAEDHAPAALRRAALSERFGFHCRCPRCALEDRLPAQLSALLQPLQADVAQRLMPGFVSAVDGGAQLEEVGNHMRRWVSQLFPALEAFVSSDTAKHFQLREGGSGRGGEDEAERSGPAFATLCVQAAIYEFFTLMAMSDEAAGADQTASLQNCIKIMDAVSRGSELHAFLTARVLVRELQAAAAVSSETGRVVLAPRASARAKVDHAIRDCHLAHLARYGSLPKDKQLELFMLSERVGRQYF